MQVLMRSHFWMYSGAFILIAIALLSAVRVLKGPDAVYVTDTVTRGDVREIVSVSGLIDADNTADLSFPTTGIVDQILVSEGEAVEANQLLMTLERRALLADRSDALASLAIAKADRDELVAGPRSESRDVTQLSVASAEEDLVRITREEAEKVSNARRSLFSADLEAFPVNRSANSVAPAITGTYKCEASGQYDLEMYSSGAKSGYSYKLTGLGSGVSGAFTVAPASLGDCGLAIQFPSAGAFGSTDWYVPVPNINGASYASNYNTYQLALEQQQSRVAEAEEALELARSEQTLENAAPRTEALDRADALVLQAQARLAAVDAALADRSIQAPFAGTITDIPAKLGETIRSETALTILSEESFDLTARIPEIDIAKIALGQNAEVLFDAAADEILEAEIVFISPLATEIDGVAYFEAKLMFTQPPTWLRPGLNADIDIVVDAVTETLRLPKRFVTTQSDSHSVLIREAGEITEQEITIGLAGSDGFVEVRGLPSGQEVIAP